MDPATPKGDISPESLYLDLLKKSLTRYIFPESYRRLQRTAAIKPHEIRWVVFALLQSLFAKQNLEIVRRVAFSQSTRKEGVYRGEWPPEAETMIGLERLNNLESCITDVIHRGIPGDLRPVSGAEEQRYSCGEC